MSIENSLGLTGGRSFADIHETSNGDISIIFNEICSYRQLLFFSQLGDSYEGWYRDLIVRANEKLLPIYTMEYLQDTDIPMSQLTENNFREFKIHIETVREITNLEAITEIEYIVDLEDKGLQNQELLQIEFHPNLQELHLDNNQLTTFDRSSLGALQVLHLNNNRLTIISN